MEYLGNNDFGDFASNDISIIFVKSQLIQNALYYYNFIIDFSWQFIWYFYEHSCIGKLPTKKLYDDIAKECNLDSLRLRLTLARDIKLRKYYIDRFFNEPLVHIPD